jgi:predicted molibdopterin-dependent oxidoreductase YjgC
MDYRFVKTTCPYCGCGCQMLLEVLDGKLIGTMPHKTAPMNQGKLCIKGWNAHEFVRSPNRLTTPLVRKNGSLQEASWDEALDLTVSRLREIKEKHGGESVAFLSSARCTNEENYLLQKFCRAGFGTNNVDACARL